MNSPGVLRCTGCGQYVGLAKEIPWQNPTYCSIRCWVTEPSVNPNFQRDDLITTLVRDGVSVVEIAESFEIARQRVYQILKKDEPS